MYDMPKGLAVGGCGLPRAGGDLKWSEERQGERGSFQTGVVCRVGS